MSATVFKSINPYTQELLAEYPLLDNANLEKAINRASEAYQIWKNFSFSAKSRCFKTGCKDNATRSGHAGNAHHP